MSRGHSHENGNLVVLSGSRIKCGMTGGDGFPIRSAMLSVENDTEAGQADRIFCAGRDIGNCGIGLCLSRLEAGF